MQRGVSRSWLVAGGVALLIAGLLGYLLLGRGGDDKAKVGGGSGTGRDGVEERHGVEGEADSDLVAGSDGELGIEPPDPAGTLLLEGQVLDEDDQPVGDAQVWVTSSPPRSATTEGDGTFSFDKLLPRDYAVTARAGESIGGPVAVRLGPDVGPVVVRLRQGASLTVRVADQATGDPVAGARVALQELGRDAIPTSTDGTAVFKGLAAGWSSVSVKADGYAPASGFTTIGVAGSAQELKVVVRKGAALSGKVVDEQGAAVKGAFVTLRDASAAWGGDRDGMKAGDDGTFEFEVVAAGSYTVSARDNEHAPGTSEIVTVDGTSARDGVLVTMSAGGVVRGRVVSKGHQPVPFASVQIAPKIQNGNDGIDLEGSMRRTTADEQGAFEIAGLPRAALRLRAESSEAASAITDVDLIVTALVADLELVLDVEGEIAGVVVDAAGEPIAEAQVTAFPDIFGGDGRLEDLGLAGLSSATTDGGGAFVLHGLPEGPYRLWASRTATGADQIFTTEGVKAKTGDQGVRIVLPKPGGLEGTLAFADGSAPALAMVSVGVMTSTPTKDGAFEVHDLPPGSYDLRVHGPDFADLRRNDVKVEAGKVTDLGTVKLSRGRRVAGRVVDAGGSPIEGARVVVGELLFSQGNADSNAAIEEQMGLRTATTKADGLFSIQGAPAKGGSMMAEHATRGRSDAIVLPAGDGDVTDVRLTLHGYGSVHGTITSAGKAVGDVSVMASAKGSTAHVVVVESSADGTFIIDKLPAGDHRLQASQNTGFSMSSVSTDITVVEGKRTEVTLDFPAGEITLTVMVKPKDGAQVDAAQIFLFNGKVAAKNAKEVVDRFLAGDAAGMNLWFGGGAPPAKFEKLVRGQYTVCTLPITGSLMDPAFQQRLQENMDKLYVYCQGTVLESSPAQQTATAIVPAMQPLPPEP